MTDEGRQGEVRARLEERYRRPDGVPTVAAGNGDPRPVPGDRRLRPWASSSSVQLFTVVIPLMISASATSRTSPRAPALGTIWITGARPGASDERPGSRRRSALPPDCARVGRLIGVRRLPDLGSPDGGDRGRVFRQAWRREQFGIDAAGVARALWFALYLTMI